MKTQQAMQQEIRADFEEKLRALQAYIEELNARAAAHDADEEHLQADLMKAENDARFYEARLRDLGAEPVRMVAPPQPGSARGAFPLGLVVAAAAAGALLGHLLSPRRFS